MANKPVFYGWKIVAASFVILILSAGIRFAVGPFLLPMLTDLGVSRTALSTIVALSMIVFGLGMVVAGRLVDTYGGRKVLATGAALLALSLMATSYSKSLVTLALWYGVLAAFGFAATSQVVLSAVLNRWFIRRRGLVLSILSAAALGGIAIMTPGSQFLVDNFGWRSSYLVFGLVIFLSTMPAALWVIRDSPESFGTFPDGVSPGNTGTLLNVSARNSTSLGKALQTTPFWLLALGFSSCGFSMNLLGTHGVPMLIDHDFQPMIAASAIGVIGAVNLGTVIIMGFISDKIGRKNLLTVIYLCRGIAFFILPLVVTPTQLFMLTSIAGLAWAGSSAMSAALTADIYGSLSSGTLFGWIFFAHQIGAAVGSYLGGWSYDVTGSYNLAFTTAAWFLVIGALVSYRIPKQHGLVVASGS